MMSHNNKQFSIKPIAAAISASLVTPLVALAQDDGRSAELEEVLVTARKREESLQDIPSSVQALSEQALKEMGAQNMEDYARFIPSVTIQNFGAAGNNSVVFRGITTGGGNFIAQAGASVYFDEVSVTTTGSQPNIRMIDINRVEALSGPQGTLYGASAQAGTLRIYSNQPDASKFEASIEAVLKGGPDSDMSHDIIGMVNIPIIEDKLAVRIAVNTAEDGGFIDNVLGHTPDGYGGYGAYYIPDGFGTITNSRTAEDNWNNAEFFNARIAARWDFNDEWSATLAYAYSDTTANGGNDYNPFVGERETIQFNDYKTTDEWDIGSLVIEGDLGWAQLVSATSFFDRTQKYSKDATAYLRYYSSWACNDVGVKPASYYWLTQDTITGTAVYYANYCLGASGSDDFSALTQGPEWQEKFTQEIRLSSQGDQFDWLLGLYYEDSSDDWDSLWMIPGQSEGDVDYQDSIAMQWWRDRITEGNGYSAEEVAQLDEARYGLFATDRTEWKQKAIFGEVTWHISEKLDLTVGGRYFERTNDKLYLQYRLGGGDVDNAYGLFLKDEFAPGTEAGAVASGKDEDFVPKVSIAYNLDDDKMIYATYTEGFRPGGTNRGRGTAQLSDGTCPPLEDGTAGTCGFFPREYQSDTVTNTEIGIKSRWADNTLQFNASIFNMEWEDYQLELLDPSKQKCGDDNENAPYCGQPWQKVVANAGDAHTRGLQAELVWVPSEGWDLGINGMWLEAEVDDDLNGTDAGGVYAYGNIEKGSDLPNVPDFQGSSWLSYSWPVEFGEMRLRGQYSYTGSSKNSIVANDGEEGAVSPQLTQDSYGIADIRLSMISEQWEFEVFINNLTDEVAMVSHGPNIFEYQTSNSADYERYDRVYTNRPREYGVRMMYRFD